MANSFTNKKLPKLIAVIYKERRHVTSKLHRTAGCFYKESFIP